MSSRTLLLGTYSSCAHFVRLDLPSGDGCPRVTSLKNLPLARASWLTRHPHHPDIWYAAIEPDDAGGTKLSVEGRVVVFRLSPEGDFEVLGDVTAHENPCHVEVVADGKGLAVANFSAGTALLLTLNSDGTLRDGSDDKYIKFEQLRDEVTKCHQAIDVPELGECWIVDTGNACMQRMKLEIAENGEMSWKQAGREDVPVGHAPRQAVVLDSGRHLYTLLARSCTVTHHDLRLSGKARLQSTHNMLPEPHKIDLANRVGPPYTTAAALLWHARSSTLIATSRLIQGEDVDAVAFFKVDKEGAVTHIKTERLYRGRELRGAGLVDKCLILAGQEDGWLATFLWNEDRDEWIQRDVEGDNRYDGVVDIKVVS